MQSATWCAGALPLPRGDRARFRHDRSLATTWFEGIASMTHRLIQQTLAEHAAAVEAVSGLAEQITEAAALIGAALSADRKLLTCGNGGSAADAQHLAAELT